MAQITGGDEDLSDPVPSQPFENELEDGTRADWHERFWQNGRMWTKSSSSAAALNYRFHLNLHALKKIRFKKNRDMLLGKKVGAKPCLRLRSFA
ncbi:hypothetical protein BJA01nite_11400 [Bradyrhizobium japonicum]|nr:hypothetical protein BJ6T_63370 [Bradyrhizobium japonicum USDA 6]GEC43498.1 hypothetical protein BJA01nite_11400 [Bradyrhizobium japonicum]